MSEPKSESSLHFFVSFLWRISIVIILLIDLFAAYVALTEWKTTPRISFG